MRSFFLATILLAACSSSDGTGDDDGVQPDAPPACVSGTTTTALTPGAQIQPMAIGVTGGQPWVVLREDNDDLVIADAAGVHPLLPGAGSDLTRATTVEFGDKRCAILVGFNGNGRFACEGGLLEDTMVSIEASFGRVVAATTTDGAIHVFAQNFAAYTEVLRSGGSWHEVEKFENSISYPEDALALGAAYATCFINVDDHPAIDRGFGDVVSAAEVAKWCRLLPGEPFGVLTDLGYTTFTGATLGGWQPTAVIDRPLAVGGGAAPFAITLADGMLQRVPLPTGTAQPLGPAATMPLVTVRDGTVFAATVATEQLATTTFCP